MIPSADRKAIVYRLARWSLCVGLRLHNRLRVEGAAHVPASGPCIIASNHTSFLDPPVVGAAVSHRVVRFMARDTLFKGLLGLVLRRACVIPLSREKGDIAAMRKALELLRAGCCIGLFPEGTRSADGRLQDAKSGIGFLIAKAGVPVIPARITGSYEAYPKGARSIGRHPIRIVLGEPILPDQVDSGRGRETYDRIGRLVMERIASLG